MMVAGVCVGKIVFEADSIRPMSRVGGGGGGGWKPYPFHAHAHTMSCNQYAKPCRPGWI